MKIITSAILLLSAMVAMAQSNLPPTFIGGRIDIKYNSRITPGVKGVKDVYSVNINVCNSALFHGTITDTPQIVDGVFSKSVTQPRSLYYDIGLDVINPKNTSQIRNVGKMAGTVPISPDGSYQYDRGNLEVSILPMGNAGGFTSKFAGLAIGKPLTRPADWLDKLKNDAVNITRSVNGKTTTVALKKYDKMELRNHVIAAGPVQFYQEATVSGELFYDYEKSCWFLNRLNVQYADNGVIKVDRINGTIRWIESPTRKADGTGEYQFDIRVNEPPPSPTAAFDTKVADESSFFETDPNVPELSGTMKYKDAIQGDTTMSSVVTVQLTGNNISKQQAMYLAKLIIFTSVVPMNAD